MRWGRIVSAGAIGGLAAAAVYSDEGLLDGLTRTGYAAAVGATILYDYKFVVDPIKTAHGEKSTEYTNIRSVVDKRSAEKLLRVAQRNGGMYIKFAQALSTNNFTLPKEYTTTLAAAQDKATYKKWDEVSRVFVEDTGQRPEDIFMHIEQEPIAAASLAQVHKAKTHEGEVVAVKIQYPHLRRQIRSDLAAMRLFVHVIERMFPDYGYSWLLPDFEASLRNEVNFLQEAHNGERVAAMFRGDPHVHIPRVYRPLSSERVLVMEFIEGVKVTDLEALKRLNVDPLQLAKQISRFFGDQLYVHGFVHCDPHPGNLMVRRDEKGIWQLVVLDHGMYRRLTPQFRAAYCRLWKALVTRDMELGKRATLEMGLDEDAYDALSLMLTFRTAKSQASLGSKMSKEDIEKIKKDYKDVSAGDINRFMQRLPRDLIFVSRNMNMVRALNLELGGTSRQRFQIMGESAVRGLILTDTVADFSSTSKRYLQAQNTDSSVAPPVSDVPEAETLRKSTSSAVWDVVQSLWRGQPPQEPLTYLNALSKDAIVTEPTDSELQESIRMSWQRRLWLQYETAKLRAGLWMLDLALAIAVWTGSFAPHDETVHAHKDPG